MEIKISSETLTLKELGTIEDLRKILSDYFHTDLKIVVGKEYVVFKED